MRGRWRKDRTSHRRRSRSVHWAWLVMLVTAALAFVVVGSGAVIVARGIARDDALAEAERSARTVADAMFVPALPRAIAGDPIVIAQLDRGDRRAPPRAARWCASRYGAVTARFCSPTYGRSSVSTSSLVEDVTDVIDHQRSHTDLSNLDAAENVTETNAFDRLVEVYTPITLANGTRLAIEIYSTDARVVAAEHELTTKLVPFALGSLVVILLAQLPLSMWLVRRVSGAQQERSRLLRNTLIASRRERQTIARELHDGVVQDLAGAGYAVSALASALPDDASPSTRKTLDRVSSAMQESVSRLRTVMVDIYPPDLNGDGLSSAIEELAERLRAQDVDVDIDLDIDVEAHGEPSPEVAATLYRCAREGLANVAKHANAQYVKLTLDGDENTVTLRLQDNGVGFVPTNDRRQDGHLGLQLIRDAAADLGGHMDLTSSPGTGTTLIMRLPTAGAAQS